MAVNGPDWTPFHGAAADIDGDVTLPVAAPAADGAATPAAPENNGSGDGTTLRSPHPGWVIIDGGRQGHTEGETVATPHPTPESVVPQAPEATPGVEETPEAAPAPFQEAEQAPQRSLRDLLTDLYGDPMAAFALAQPAISDRIAYAETAPWTKAKGPLRNLGIAYNRVIGNPGVATGYLYAEMHSRPAHWVSTLILNSSWHFTMMSFGWNLIWGWVLTGVAWWFCIAVTAYVVGKQPPASFGPDSGAD